MSLPFRPNCLPTALGALPYRTMAPAWDACTRHLTKMLPLPLLVTEGEDPSMLAAEGFGGALMGDERLRIDREAVIQSLDELYLAYLRNRIGTRSLDLLVFEGWASREAQAKRAQAVCTMLMGPVSLALRLVDADSVPVLEDMTIVDALAKHLYLRLSWLHSRLRRDGQVVVQWLYEPYLEVVDTPFSSVNWQVASELLDTAFGVDTGVRAVWVSTTANIERLIENPAVDIVGLPFPLSSTIAHWAVALRAFIQRQGVIGWGLVPQTAEGLANIRIGRLSARFEEMLQVLEDAGVARADVLAASLIMPEDTLSSLEPTQTDQVLALTNQLAGHIRHSYGLD